MMSGGHVDPAKCLRDLPNAFIVRCYDHFREGARLLAALDNMLNERFARDQCQRFARKPGGSVTGRDDAENFHWPCSIPCLGPGSKAAKQLMRVRNCRPLQPVREKAAEDYPHSKTFGYTFGLRPRLRCGVRAVLCRFSS